MTGVRRILLLHLLLGATQAQQKEWDLDLCKNRGFHWRHNQHNYLFSGEILRKPDGGNVELDWKSARAFCRSRCMDLVALNNQNEHNIIRRKMKTYGAKFVWTSGHICDLSVSSQCYNASALPPPRIVNGWFWAGNDKQIPPTDSVPPRWTLNPWGSTGVFRLANCSGDSRGQPGCPGDRPQPDNGEQLLGLLKEERPDGENDEEACLALATDLWQEETVWNDIACWHPKQWICEDSEQLLKESGIRAPIIFG